ncbi:hypothetical protein N480_00155 [Pseudoalteromonas luteoviolacea S2607]|nr:hypothetical protein N480_00155 [Pseudoalteromonas luteoviolacea S2607]
MLSKGPLYGGIGFSAIGALSVPLTDVVPNLQDAIIVLLYRFSSIFMAIVIAVLVMLAA